MNAKLKFTLPAALVSMLFTAPAMAAGDASAGEEKAKACQACHGLDGSSVDPQYPNLAGQHESYLIKALGDYRSGARKNAVMAPMSAGLSDQDILDLARWYSIQDGLKDLSIK